MEIWTLSDWIGILISSCFLHNHSLNCVAFTDIFTDVQLTAEHFLSCKLQFSLFCKRKKKDFTPTGLLVPTQIIHCNLSILVFFHVVFLGFPPQTCFFLKLKIFSLNWNWRGFVAYYISYIKHCMWCVTTGVSRWNWFNNFKDLTHSHNADV